jgi:hypothetical protein
VILGSSTTDQASRVAFYAGIVDLIPENAITEVVSLISFGFSSFREVDDSVYLFVKKWAQREPTGWSDVAPARRQDAIEKALRLLICAPRHTQNTLLSCISILLNARVPTSAESADSSSNLILLAVENRASGAIPTLLSYALICSVMLHTIVYVFFRSVRCEQLRPQCLQRGPDGFTPLQRLLVLVEDGKFPSAHLHHAISELAKHSDLQAEDPRGASALKRMQKLGYAHI